MKGTRKGLRVRSCRLLLLVAALIAAAALLLMVACDGDDDDAGDDDDLGDDDTGNDDTGDDDTGDDDAGDDDVGDDDAGDDDAGDDDDDIAFDCEHDQNYRDESAKIHLIDIPVGEVIYIQTQWDYNILINGGPEDDGNLVINYLLDQGVVGLQELVIASILDEDLGEIPDILSAFPVDLVRKTPAESASDAYLGAMNRIAELEIPVVVNQAGETIDWLGDPELVLGPIYPFPEDYTDRDKGLVIKFSVGRQDVLLAGSITAAAEYDIVDLFRETVCSEALKVSFHGSNDATNEVFLDGVDPEQAVIIAGWNNPGGFPHEETIEMLDERLIIYGITAYQGNMVWQSDGWDLWFCQG